MAALISPTIGNEAIASPPLTHQLKRMSDSEEVGELRAEALRALSSVGFAAWGAVLVGSLVYAEVSRTPPPLGPLLVVLLSLLVMAVLHRAGHSLVAALVLVCGLLAAPAVYIWLAGPVQPALFFFLAPVITASVLLGAYHELRVAMLACLVMFGVTLVAQPQFSPAALLHALGLVWAPAFFCVLVAAVVHLQSRNTVTMLHWLAVTQRKDTQRADLFFAQQRELRQLSTRLSAANAQLEAANNQLRALNRELDEARETAEVANRLKTRLLANVSHELRTPLSIVLGVSQAILLHPQRHDAQTVRDLHHIQRSGKHLSRLINDLLDLSRAEIDALELFPEPIAPATFLSEVFQSMAAGADPAGGVQWRLELPPRLPEIAADPLRLRQILLNLLANAAQFTAQGEIVLGAEVALPHLHIWIADTGCGVPPELQTQIFEPFVSTPPTGRRSGIGLGLSITRHLVALHQGALSLQSRVGSGSVFHLYLPLSSLAGPPATLPAGRAPALLLLNEGGEPPDELLSLARRQAVALRPVAPAERLATLLAEVTPVGVIWELGGADSAAWATVEELRRHPELCQIPFILFRPLVGNDASGEGLTSVHLKPLSEPALVAAVTQVQGGPAGAPLLVVDDDPAIRARYAELLGRSFPERPVRGAEDGVEAMRLMAEAVPALVILDLAMPQVDGFAVLEQMRADPRLRRVPVLVLSGRLLGYEEVERLSLPLVVAQSKGVLQPDELVTRLSQMLEAPGHTPATSAVVKQAMAYIHTHYAEPLSRQTIAAAVGVTERYLTRIFHEELGVVLWEYLTRYRVLRARTLLATSNLSVGEVAARVGFDDPSYFGRIFRRVVGVTPSTYREGNLAEAAPQPF